MIAESENMQLVPERHKPQNFNMGSRATFQKNVRLSEIIRITHSENLGKRWFLHAI